MAPCSVVELANMCRMIAKSKNDLTAKGLLPVSAHYVCIIINIAYEYSQHVVGIVQDSQQSYDGILCTKTEQKIK